ncbi:MAG: UvrD-helicase domain-containing protein [Lysobacterales bacterium]
MSAPRDALDLPLDGIRVVEASAGTGKTFTIATLYLRLILERGLAPEEIVVATFTRAAAAELSERLRKRLVVADDLLAAADPGQPRDDDDGEKTETRRVIDQAISRGVAGDELKKRAHDARLAIDTALIGTLHGFCHRALAEFGFESGQALREPELVEDLRALELEIVRDFWRGGGGDPEAAQCLAANWGDPGTLVNQVADARWRGRTVDPLAARPDTQVLREHLNAARAVIASWDDAALERAREEIRRAIGNGSSRKSLLEKVDSIRMESASPRDDAAFTKAVRKDLAAFSDEKFAGKEWFNGPFQGSELPSIQHLAAAIDALDAADGLLAAHLLRAARACLEAELPRRLAARNQMSHDGAVDRLAAALDDPARSAGLEARIGARWKAALIDEFQDTDAQQWKVVHELFGTATLVLVGDPKQAIYGFRGGDVFAWLAACACADGPALRLAESHRAGAGIACATNALFSQPGAFIDAGIGHPEIRAADRVARRALLRGDDVVPALQVWRLDPAALGCAADKSISKGLAWDTLERACVAQIATWLADGSGFALRDDDGETKPLRAKNIAVLVDKNDQARSLQAALGRAGIPAASESRASVHASDEASDLALLLAALAAPDDARRARAACASVLVGEDAAAIATTIHDDAAHAALLERVAEWAANVRQQGPLPWLHRLIASAGPRLLSLPDGQRRVANYLQLAELLQELHAQCFSLADLASRFARARAEAADDADAARLRLDTDADAVTVSTVHVAKGLEYDVVLVPCAVLGHKINPAKRGSGITLHWYHVGNVPHVAIGSMASADARRQAAQEDAAEDVRKLYVAVTRASAACVLPWGWVNEVESSALYHVLQPGSGDDGAKATAKAAACGERLKQLRKRAGADAVRVVELPVGGARRYAPAQDHASPLHAREFRRDDLERDWRTWSFSSLVRGRGDPNAGDTLPGAGDSDPVPAVEMPGEDRDLAGPRFGTAVHAVFEATDFATWRDVADAPVPARALIEHSLRTQGLASATSRLARGVAAVSGFVRNALNTTLPCGARLCDIAPARRRAEIEFHLALHPARSSALYALLHRHGYQSERGGVEPDRLHGLLTGKIDLVFAHAGRFHIVDWKTNRCPPYDAAALGAEVTKHDYDLQWLLYTLALHRWLRQQVPGYAYDTHVGEVYYLFVRGIVEGRGVHRDRPPRDLIAAMDALFDTDAEAAA